MGLFYEFRWNNELDFVVRISVLVFSLYPDKKNGQMIREDKRKKRGTERENMVYERIQDTTRHSDLNSLP